MALPQDSVNMALFCDFENIALGVRDTKFEKFDIKPVLEKLLVKGSIVVKKAYCDWERYKTFKAAMHEASFELIEIPHVRQSGKNSADIRLVVDALDLCYTKSHVDTFVIISGDSDFSPLVSKLRENAKRVIGVGVKNSTSDLLVANCDEFIFYDDLAREQQRTLAKREARADSAAAKRADEDKQRKQDGDARKAEAIAIAVETLDALVSERGESGKIWASVLKSAIKRRKPGFNESYYGFRAFGNLLDEAQARGLLEIGRDDKSGTFVSRAAPAANEAARAAEPTRLAADAAEVAAAAAAADTAASAEKASGKKGRGKARGRKHAAEHAAAAGAAQAETVDLFADTGTPATAAEHAEHAEHAAHIEHAVPAGHPEPSEPDERARREQAAAEPPAAAATNEQEHEKKKPARSRARKHAAKSAKTAEADSAHDTPGTPAASAGETQDVSPEPAPARKAPSRSRRTRKAPTAANES